jgi:FAD synthase
MIYGKTVTVSVKKKIRNIIAFSGKALLMAQLENDKEIARIC